MKPINVVLDLTYDPNRVSPSEVVFNLKRALDDYFERYDDYDDAIVLREVKVEDVSDLFRRDS